MTGNSSKAPSSDQEDKVVIHYRQNRTVLLAVLSPEFKSKVKDFRDGLIPFDKAWMMTDTIFQDRLGLEASKAVLESVFGTEDRTKQLEEMVKSGDM
mmetsp:Transcript_16724/g.29303  ORF Transcript_16724/g.29303 Transcript_16724/m.29303 type:complete len:97 (+) Transcript_16724:174-464(+)